MDQVGRSDPHSYDSRAEKPKHSASRAAGNNSESLASLAIVSIGDGDGARASYPTNDGTRDQQLAGIY